MRAGTLAAMLAAPWLAALWLGACDAASISPSDEAPLARLDPPIRARTVRGCYELELRAEPPAPALGELFAITTTVRDAQRGELARDTRVAIDAAMPHHGHGMITRPEHHTLGEGRHRSAGLKLHMPGRWVLTVRVEGRCSDHAAIAIEQPPAHVEAQR